MIDETTASLDFGNQALVLTEVASLSGDGLTVMLSTHDPDHALAIGTQVVLPHEGPVRAAGARRRH
ncbi:ABC transporter ATP-binding protein [Roseibium aquae]|uniref:ATP-binding cassette domain-containing protein n=1 Tax=Roseibium aquae TaxID=1323746 RepID=UPI00123CFEAD|nr:ABC transporter ATP-binding protein [Roseibium aquae]